MPRREPEDIFTPKAIPTREMFTRRNEPSPGGDSGLQERLQNALKVRGGQVLIYGDTGVGKSSLLRYAAEDAHMNTLVVQCRTSQTYEDLVEEAVRQVIDVRVLSRTENTSKGVNAEGVAGFLSVFSIKGSVSSESGANTNFEIIQQSPLESLITTMTRASKRILVLDNFQNIMNEETRQNVAQTMELMSDRADSIGDIKTVVIGIAKDASLLLGGSGSYLRRTANVLVPRMPENEIRDILESGFALLDIQIPEAILRKLVFFSDGFPFFAHELGLHTSRKVRAAGLKPQVVTDEVLKSALREISSGVDASYAVRFAQAVEIGGNVQPMKNIMKILAMSSKKEWTGSQVIDEWKRTFPDEDKGYQFLHTALAKLSSENKGSILIRTGSRKKYVYQFSDPHLRPLLRLKIEEDSL